MKPIPEHYTIDKDLSVQHQMLLIPNIEMNAIGCDI
jgi:hypothetical protein